MTRTIAAVGAVAAVVAGALLSPQGAPAAPLPPVASRGGVHVVPGAQPRVLFSEDFENGMSTRTVMLNQYVGRNGEHYTAAPQWIDAQQCNGIVTSARSTAVSACGRNAEIRGLASVLGQAGGTDPGTNHAVSAWTEDRNVPVNAVQVEPTTPTRVGASGRFISFGVVAAAGSCGPEWAHPKLAFSLVDGATERNVSDHAIDPCTEQGSATYSFGGQSYRAGRFTSSGGLLFSGDTVQWRLRNQQGSYSGNDGAIDGVTVLDSTPVLANAYAGEPFVGDTARMTARVVNTAERGSKPGWSFAEDLPEGLHIAPDPKMQTTCQGATVSAPAGGDALAVRNGSLARLAADCTVSFDVVADRAGTYTITADDVTEHVGVDLPEPASVTFRAERNALAVTDRAVLTDGNDDDVADLGEQVAFASTVRNDGDVPVHDLAVTGRNGTVTCGADELAPGASTSCTSPARAVTQSDLDAGRIDDTVDATAVSRGGATVTGSASASVDTTASAPAVEATLRTVVDDGPPGVGGTVGLRLRVRNSGTVTLHDPTATIDDRPGFRVDCPDGPLAPGDAVDCAVDGRYTVTQEDVDRGSVPFAATVVAKDPRDGDVRGVARADQPTIAPAPAVGTRVTAALPDGAASAPGTVADVSVRVTNTGNVTLTDPASTFTRPEDITATCPPGPLAPGASVDCATSGYPLTQQDVDAGAVRFDVRSTGVAPDGATVSATDATTLAVAQEARITTTLTAVRADQDRAPRAGEHVRLTAVVTNAGNVTVHDPRPTGVEATCPQGALAPGAELACAVEDHVLTQREIDEGSVGFALHVVATAPDGGSVEADDRTAVPLAAAPSIAVGATSALAPSEHEVPFAGDDAQLTTTVENTGNVTLHDVTAVVRGRGDTRVHCPDEDLAPGDRTTCTVDRVALTQAEIDAGTVHFDVDGRGSAPSDAEVTATAPTDLPLPRATAISASASAVLTPVEHALPRAGDGTALTLVVRNTGNTTVRDTSALVVDRPGTTVRCPAGPVAPGAEVACEVDGYPFTQDDVDAGRVDFAFTVTATGADDRQATASPTAGVDVERRALLDAELSAHLAASEHEVPRPGDLVELAATLRNTGNVTLRDPHAEMVELADGAVDCPADPLAPGESIVCTVTDHVLTQSEIEEGVVPFVLVGTGTGPDDHEATDRDEVRVGLLAANRLDLRMSPVVRTGSGTVRAAGAHEVFHDGDVVAVRGTLQNTGNLEVHGIRTGDGQPVSCAAATLAPGAETTCEGRFHTVTDADVRAGHVLFRSQAEGRVTRADGATEQVRGSATTGQTEGHGATPLAATAEGAEPDDDSPASVEARPVRVVSQVVPNEVLVEARPGALAFTGTEVLRAALPAGAALLLGGVLLLARARRRSRGAGGSVRPSD